MNNKELTFKKNFITLLSILIILCLVLFYIIYSNNQNKIDIKGIKEATINDPIPNDTYKLVDKKLYEAIQNNSYRKVNTQSIKDAMVRKNSTHNQYDSTSGKHTTEIIVDIPSIKQSYYIRYQWFDDSKKNKNKILDEYTNLPLCPKNKDIIYKTTACEDVISEADKQDDPIISFLPYSTTSITLTLDTNRKKTLNAKIELDAAEEKDNPGEYVKEYKKEINNWIKSKGFNPSDYTINYNVIHPSLY